MVKMSATSKTRHHSTASASRIYVDVDADCEDVKCSGSLLQRPADKMTTVRDVKYIPIERDDAVIDRVSREITSFPQDASLAARYTAGVMLMNKDKIFKPAHYILAPGLAKCPDVVFEICPSAGVLYLGKHKQILFKFVNDEDVEVIVPIAIPSVESGSSFADALTRTLYDSVFYWSEEPVVVTFNAASVFSPSSSGDKVPIQMTSFETGPFNTAIFYGGQTQGGPCGVYNRMRPLLNTPKFLYSYSPSRTTVFCPSDAIIATLMKDVYHRF